VHTKYSSGIGGFYSIVTAGITVTYTATLKDAYNNTASNANPIHFDVKDHDSLRTIPGGDVVRSSCLDQIDTLPCPINSLDFRDSGPVISVTPLNSDSGAVQISFLVTKSGKYAFRSRLFRKGGLASEYYNTMEFKTKVSGLEYALDQMAPLITRVDETPSNDWGTSSPSPANIPIDYFSVRYRGYIMGPCTCAVNIILSTDFGVRLVVNGRVLIDQVPSLQSQISVSVDFKLGSLLPIIVEYVHNTGPSHLKIAWASSSWILTEIPSSSFYFDVSIGRLSQYLSVLPGNPIWSLSHVVKSLNGFVITAGVPVSFSVSASDSYGNCAHSFDSTKIFGKWNFPFYNISGIGTATVVSETTTQVIFSVSQSLAQGARLYGKFSNGDEFFIGVMNALCNSNSCTLTRASQIAFSNIAFYFVQNTDMQSVPVYFTQLGDFSSPFNGLTATYFSPHTSKFSAVPSLNPVKVLCQKGSFFDPSSCDQTLDFSSPISNGIINGAATFGVRWSGLLLTQTPGIYTLYGIASSSNEFATLKINGTNRFFEVGAGSFATISSSSAFNTLHDIVVEYQKTSSASAVFSFQLKWKGPGISLSVIPNKVLFPLGSTFVATATSNSAHQNISEISIGSIETNGLSSTFYNDISGSIPIASRIYDTLELKLACYFEAFSNFRQFSHP
jgi:hypothetical protein